MKITNITITKDQYAKWNEMRKLVLDTLLALQKNGVFNIDWNTTVNALCFPNHTFGNEKNGFYQVVVEKGSTEKIDNKKEQLEELEKTSYSIEETLINTRIDYAKAMHNFIIEKVGDEDIYAAWTLLGIPDCPTEEDFEFFAEDDEEWDDLCELFTKLTGMPT